MDAIAGTSDKLKVFISYSRAQVHAADDVEFVLEKEGFEVRIDRRDIPRGHPDFFSHLEEMILGCDTVVFILSDDSASSAACEWEVDKANGLNRRILVITLADLSEGIAPPAGLAGIDWIHCWRNPKIPGSSEAKGFAELAMALRTDVDWLQQQTRLQQRAAQYVSNPVEALLMRGEELEVALAWAQSTPSGQTVSLSLANYIAASERVEADRKFEAEKQIAKLEKALKAAEAANADLENMNARLRKDRVLKAALSYEFSKDPIVIGSRWMTMAFENEMATCTILCSKHPRGSGFLISGNLLVPDWSSKPVLVTANFVFGHGNKTIDVDEFEFQLSLSENPDKRYNLVQQLHLSEHSRGVAVFSVSNNLPNDAKPIQSVADAAYMLKLPNVSTQESKISEVDLTDNVVLSYAANSGLTPELLMMRVAGIESVDELSSEPRMIWMPSATLPGSSGAAIIDSQSGALVGVHMVSIRDHGAGCAWIGDVIDDIRRNAVDEE